MEYRFLRQLFRAHERKQPETHLTGYITFAPERFAPNTNYNEVERTYVISSDNKAFQPNMGGYSIFGSCLDGKTDPCLRLDYHMAEENGDKKSWVVEKCCLIGYLLLGSNERKFLTPRLFYTRSEAEDAMLRSLCREGSLGYDKVKASFQKHHRICDSDDYAADPRGAWINTSNGNWDWQIETVRIYDPLDIVFGSAGTTEETEEG